ncbi:MAG: GNAT family N-acetyltransferase [Clostridia bacterium]|nr:GNAT family N-acetyltransferase [Clostridia bacterium]
MSIRFTPAVASDAPTIASLRQQIWSTTYRGIYPDVTIDYYDLTAHTQRDLAKIQDQSQRVYLIRDGEEPIGYFSFSVSPKVHILSLYVLRQYQKQGIGKAAIGLIQTYCRDHRIPGFTCNCNEHNTPARRFYEHMGGTVVKVDSGHENRQEDQVTYQFTV